MTLSTQADAEAGGGVPLLPGAPGQREGPGRRVQRHWAHHHERVVRSVIVILAEKIS